MDVDVLFRSAIRDEQPLQESFALLHPTFNVHSTSDTIIARHNAMTTSTSLRRRNGQSTDFGGVCFFVPRLLVGNITAAAIVIKL